MRTLAIASKRARILRWRARRTSSRASWRPENARWSKVVKQIGAQVD